MSNDSPPNSRYFGTTDRFYTAPSGETVAYIARRIIPELDRYQVLDRHRAVASERVDQVADGFYGDPEQYWRICDANGVERPSTTLQPVGRLLVVPLPLELTGRGNS
jgi:hypothetical protein